MAVTYDYFAVRPIWRGTCVAAKLIVENGQGQEGEVLLKSDDIRLLIDSLALTLDAMGVPIHVQYPGEQS